MMLTQLLILLLLLAVSTVQNSGRMMPWQNAMLEDTEDGQRKLIVVADSISPIVIDGTNTSQDWDDCPYVIGSGTSELPYTIRDINLEISEQGSGILIKNTEAHFLIENCSIHQPFDNGELTGVVKLRNCSNGIVRNNTLYSSSVSGIVVIDSYNIIIQSNNITKEVDDLTDRGVFLQNTNHSQIDDIICSFHSEGFRVEHSWNISLSNIGAFNNSASGVYIQSCWNVNVTDSIIDSEYALETYDSNFIIIRSCNLTSQSNSPGSRLFWTNQSVVERCVFKDSKGLGLWLSRSFDNSIIDTDFIDTHGAIAAFRSSRCDIISCTFIRTWVTINFESGCYNNTIRSCRFENTGGSSLYLQHNTDSTRILDNVFVSSSGLLFGSFNNTLDNNTWIDISYHDACFTISDSSFTKITNNTCSGGLIGLLLEDCFNNTISHNNFTDCENGLVLEDSTQNTTVHDNMCRSNSMSGILLRLGASNNTVYTNNCTENSYGITIESGSTNHIYDNFLVRNTLGCIIDLGTDSNIHDNYCYLVAPVILTSSQTIYTNQFNISWSEIVGADSYNVYIDEVYNMTVSSSWANVVFPGLGTYAVTVAAVHDAVEGARSTPIDIEVAPFVPDPPTITTPSQTIDVLNITIQWTTVEYAESYNVYIDGNFFVNVIDNETLVTFLGNGDFDITIRSVNGTEESSPSNVVTITVDLPPLDSPIITSPSMFTYVAYSETVTFRWTEVADADSYNVYIDSVFHSTVFTNETSFSFEGLGFGAKHVTVTATKSGLESEHSDPLQINVRPPAPILITESQTISETSILLQWNEVAGVDYYKVSVNAVYYGNSTGSSLLIVFPGEGTYEIRVGSWVEGGIETDSSNVAIITIIVSFEVTTTPTPTTTPTTTTPSTPPIGPTGLPPPDIIMFLTVGGVGVSVVIILLVVMRMKKK